MAVFSFLAPNEMMANRAVAKSYLVTRPGSSNGATNKPSALRSGWARHARLEPSQVVISADFVASNQCFDRRQKLPIANVFGVNLIGISVQHTFPDIVHLFLQQLNFGRVHTRA
jgi:hypothetical protein